MASISINSGQYITSLALSCTPVVTGSALDISAFPNLTGLNAFSNGITSFGGFETSPYLKNCSLQNNSISGDILTLFANYYKKTGLQTFYIQSNSGITGRIGQSLSGMSNILYFNCSANQLSGSIPDISSNVKLLTFAVNNNQLTGTIPSLSNNTALNTFYCNFNQLSGSIPILSSNKALVTFECNNNQLTGTIPSLSNNTALNTFYCSYNQLTGYIPNLSSNTALGTFCCHYNQLTGTIPSLSSNTALATFECNNNNQLTGTIPSLSNNTALVNFYCSYNKLTGSIPNLNSNTALVNFGCNNNQLTGFAGATVPATLGNFVASTNQLPVTAVNAILAAFVAANRTAGTRILNMGGVGNAAPTGQGLTDKATLSARGWTVTTN